MLSRIAETGGGGTENKVTGAPCANGAVRQGEEGAALEVIEKCTGWATPKSIFRCPAKPVLPYVPRLLREEK